MNSNEVAKGWRDSLILRGQKDPVWWISTVLGDVLWSKQKEICQSLVDHERTACPACFSDDTEILTETRGFQLFKDLLPTDKVGSYCNGHLVFVYPQAFHVYDYDGDLIGYDSEQLNFLITPNHRCLIKNGSQYPVNMDWFVTEAGNLYKFPRSYVSKELIWAGVDDSFTEKHYELFGFWCADGSIETGDNAIWITQKNYVDYAKDLLSVFGLPVKEYNKGDGKILAVRDKDLTAWFLDNFGRYKSLRRLPLWLKQAPAYKLRAFVKGFFKADGSYFDTFGEKYKPNATIDIYYKGLAEDFYEVCLKAGFGASIHERQRVMTDAQYGGARITKCWLIGLLRNNQFALCARKKLYSMHYSGKVYCVSVPSGFIYVRRNGLVHVSGNSYGVGKCMAYGEAMVLADGNVVPIESLIGKFFEVHAWDLHTNTVQVSDAFAEDNGVKPVYEVMTDVGLSIIRTGNHPLWVISSNLDDAEQLAGWVSVEHLRSGMWVAAKIPKGGLYKMSKQLPPGYGWQRVEYVKYLGKQSTVGVCVPNYNTYLTTFVEHNTFLAARLALWFLYCFRPAKVISTAPTSRQVRDLLWSELRTAHRKAKVPLGGKPLQLSLTLAEDHFAVGFSTDEDNTDKFTGYHSPNQLVIFDQAAGIPTALWESAEGLMTSKNCRWLAISNTAISDSELANICIPGRRTRFGNWNIIKIRASESPNVVAGKDLFPGLVSYDWVKRRTEAWGKDDPLYKIFIEAEFVQESEMTVVPYRYISPALDEEGEVDGVIEIGVDVARGGLDSTVFVARSGTQTLRIERLTGHNTMEVVGALVEFKKQVEEFYGMPVVSIKIDTIGIGAGVYDRCLELSDPLPMIGVNNAESPVVDVERYLNLRAEQCWHFRTLMEWGSVKIKGVVVNDSDILEYLKQDIQTMKYKISNSSGKIQIWSKTDLKSILGRSPDYFDAMVLAYCTPGGLPSLEVVSAVPNRQKKDEIGFGESFTQQEWDILFGVSVPLDHESFRHESRI